LLTFEEPPLNEVALAVQFQANAVDYTQAARLREQLKDMYPKRQEQPARPPMEESFAPPTTRPPFEIQVIPAPTIPRLWFLSEDEALLVQVQHDLLAYNWRRRPGGQEYPRYEAIRAAIEHGLTQLDAVVREDSEAGVIPNWCEITYINHVEPQDDETEPPPIRDVLEGVDTPPLEGFLPRLEDAQVGFRFRIPGKEQPRGRLNFTTIAAHRNADSVPIWAITLTARVLAENGDGIDRALEALDVGHEWVVNGFRELTSGKMHERWRIREDGNGVTSS